MIISKEVLAKFIHERYEFHAKSIGWKTQEKCQVEFDNLPKENKQTMLLTAEDILNKVLESMLYPVKDE